MTARWVSSQLSFREWQTSYLFGEGWPLKQVAAALCISTHTAAGYVKQARQKLEADGCTVYNWVLLGEALSLYPAPAYDDRCGQGRYRVGSR